jgi:hypothetical protein
VFISKIKISLLSDDLFKNTHSITDQTLRIIIHCKLWSYSTFPHVYIIYIMGMYDKVDKMAVIP